MDYRSTTTSLEWERLLNLSHLHAGFMLDFPQFVGYLDCTFLYRNKGKLGVALLNLVIGIQNARFGFLTSMTYGILRQRLECYSNLCRC